MFEEFAAERSSKLESFDSDLLPSVRRALKDFKSGTAWYAPIVDKAIELGGDAVDAKVLRETLSHTKDPADTAGDTDVRIAKWVATYVLNAMEHDEADDASTKTWITMHDDRVRHAHADLDGKTIPSKDKFDVDGARLAFPGQPVGDPAGWINCRCVLKTTKGAEMSLIADLGPNTDAENAPPVDPADLPASDPGEPQIDADTQVPFHGVATVTDKPTGDRRQLSKDGFSARPLPLPVFYQRAQGDGHGGSTIVGQFTRIEINDAGEVEYDGIFNYTPEAQEAIQGVAEGWLKGVSVDLDDVMVDYSKMDVAPPEDDSRPISEIMDEMQQEVTVFKSWRVAGLTIVGIPAFHQAYIALGSRADAAAADVTKKRKPGDTTPPPADPSTDHDPATAPDDTKPGAKKKAPNPDAPPADDPNATPPAQTPPDSKKRKPAPFPPKKGADAETEEFAPGTHDGPGWITAPIPTGRIRRYWTHGEGALKINWGVPGDFNRCRSELGKYIVNQDWLAGACANMHKEATGGWPGHAPTEGASIIEQGALVASAFNLVAAAPVDRPPLEWFQDPHLAGPTPITIEGDHIYGHIATWGTCHIGLPGQCTSAPQSNTDYAWFRLGAIQTDAGIVPVGQITMDTGHADLRETNRSAAAHYDNTGTAVADIATGEDDHGIWFSGRIRPSATGDQRDALLAAKLSGDWREVQGHLELVAALAVNTPGFGIPRLGLAASGQLQNSLIAAGMVEETREPTLEETIAETVTRVLALRDRRAALSTTTARLRELAETRKHDRIVAAKQRFGR